MLTAEQVRSWLEHWKIAADWVAALATVAAVWVALYLARRASSQKAHCWVGHRIAVEIGSGKPYPESIVFGIVNRGERPLRITQIGWKTGGWRKRFAVQTFDAFVSSRLPVDLAHGEEAEWFVPLSPPGGGPWLPHFAEDMLMPHYRVTCFTLRGRFFSSLGNVFSAKPDRPLLSKLRAACKRLANVPRKV